MLPNPLLQHLNEAGHGAVMVCMEQVKFWVNMYAWVESCQGPTKASDFWEIDKLSSDLSGNVDCVYK